MCGITGQVTDNQVCEAATLDRMCDVLVHRGPDDRGVYREGNLGLAMRRLSVLDVSGSQQPLFNEDCSLCLVFNGEIYNYRQLRADLIARGHRFKTDGDGETILHLYEEFGAQCVQKLRGMFSFALWDKESERLVIAVDHFGIKPLFYFWNQKSFVFGSEIKSLLEYPEVSLELDLSSLQQYLTFLYVPGQNTLVRGIEKLPPGHLLILEDNQLSVERYFELGHPEQLPARSEEQWVESFLEAVKESVSAQMISDVPLGAFLSGGVDSSLVVALMSQLSPGQVKTFSVGYDSDGHTFDEREYARIVAKHCRTDHRELVITSKMAQEALPEILSRLDVPFGDASVVPNYLLSQFARQHVTVALSGLGCDEFCAGYERHLGALLPERYRILQWLLGNSAVPGVLKLLPDSKSGKHWQERLKRFAESAALPLEQRYFRLITKFSAAEQRSLLLPEVTRELAASYRLDFYSDLWQRTAGMSDLRRILKTDIESYLPHDLLALSDRTSMSHSLELRVPFVDQQLARFLWNIPDNLTLNGLSKKYLAKKAAARLLPKEVIYRKKRGFSVPLSVWFRAALRDYVCDHLTGSRLQRLGLFNAKEIDRILQEHFSLKRNHDEKIFALLSFVVWHEQSVKISQGTPPKRLSVNRH